MSLAFVTATIPFANANAAAVESALAALGNPARPDIASALQSSGIVHFASLNVVPGGPRTAAHLLLEAAADGSEDDAIEAIVLAIGEPLDAALVAGGVRRGGNLADFLRGHSRALGSSWGSTVGLPFCGTPGMRVTRIRDEAKLATRVAAMLDSLPPRLSALERLAHVRDALWLDGDAKWAFVPEPAPILAGAPDSGIGPLVRALFGESVLNSPFDPIVGARTIAKLMLSAIVTFLWPLLVLPTAAFALALSLRGGVAACVSFALVLTLEAVAIYVQLRHGEERDGIDDCEPASADVDQVMRHETHCAQNLLYSVSTLKPGLLRGFAARVAFWSVGLVGHFCRPGFLGSNRVIHFARWLVVPGTDKLVFLSNYDGTWNGYVGDFVLNAAGAHGVTAIWSNCTGFPRTRNLVEGGAEDRDRLVRWARRQQRPVPFWYSAYPTLTTDRIRVNAAIRQGLACAQSQSDAEDWLACFGSMPRPPQVVQSDEVPTLAFGGLPRLPFAACEMISLGDDPARCRRFLESLEPHVAYGEVLAGQSATVIGLAASALAKLGLADADLATFPVAFQQGIAAPSRSRALGDVGTDDPATWDWGGPRTRSADVLVVLYAASREQLAAAQDAVRRQASELGHTSVFRKELELKRVGNGPSYEAFGFADGISQPVLRNTWRARREGLPNDLIAPGELLLGYPDNIDRFPPTPSVAARHDPDHLLPDMGPDPRRQRPDFARAQASGRRDLGRNGTFLVVRQLEQHVEAFDEWLDGETHRLATSPSMPGDPALRKELIAAKVVGRWRDGTSLVHYFDRPGSTHNPPAPVDNDFMYGRDDPQGLRCPLGAHIRRANPRDGLTPGSVETLSTVNRHRMLRVGRSYGATSTDDPGLMFMCVNADIERQFEFLQTSWLLEKSFQGLEDESDSVLGHGAGERTFTVATERGPLRLRGLRDFVRVRGGGYFFLPSRSALRFLARYR